MAALTGTRATDRLFQTFRTWADLRVIDPTIEASERRPRHCYRGDPQSANHGVFGIGALSTLRSWLSMWSLETSQCTAAPHLVRITVASLVVQAIADAGVCESGVCAIFSALAATDRGLALLGADQHFTEPAGARVQLAELIAGWLGEHAA